MAQNNKTTNCRFALSVMANNYKTMILDALSAVDPASVVSFTDLLSTTYIGNLDSVLATVQAVFTAVNDGKTHITLEATIRPDANCDGLQWQSSVATPVSRNFLVHGKINLYPLGITDYQPIIDDISKLARECGVFVQNNNRQKPTTLQAIDLCGDVQDLFVFFTKTYECTAAVLIDFVIQISLSINSPSLSLDNNQGSF